MKKTIFAVGLLFALGTSFAMAQDGSSSEGMVPAPMFGVEGGINLASLNGPSAGAIYDSKLGFVGGAFLNFHLTESLAVQPEVLYAQKGGKINGNTYSLDYVEIPLLLNVGLVGPLGVILGPAFNSVVATNGINNANNSDVGLVLGAQINVSKVLVSGRYEIGLNDVSSNSKTQNGTFTFLVGLSLI